ncbi:Tfp pilus assembly protein FimT/FimU [Calothrix sp. CCY 0018]|uniref:Tfp pilus assembly protein FimT/FimU n=1 Tax=Calothrix sp. CCY 0018 TaxID=3103864 RepID=UPI0039C61AA2
MLYKLPIKVSSTKSKQSSGFTLIEVLVTIAIVGILSAIAAPSWLGFVARQRLNKANDTVFAALQQAQREAKKNKRSYSVSIQLNNSTEKIPQISVHPGLTPPDTASSSWRNIGADLEIKPGTILLFTNLNGNNSADSTINYTNTSALNTPKTITFDYRGALDLPVKTGTAGLTAVQDEKLGDKGLIIALATPNPSNNNQASDVKRCVIVKTLIGGIRTGINDQCN